VERNHFLRNADAGALAEIFLVTAAVSIVLTRVFLRLAGYPQVGGGSFHIAHMLWGGLLLVVALLLVLSLLNRRTKYVAAFLGGAGFGLFIDELGKFITADNNYFFRPTYALIYVIFVLLYLVIRRVFMTNTLTPTEYTANSLELLKEVVANDYSPQEKERMLLYLERAQSDGGEVNALLKYARAAKATGVSERSYYARVKTFLLLRYRKLVETLWFKRSVLFIFLGQATWYVFDITRFIAANTTITANEIAVHEFGFYGWGFLFSATLATALIAVGVLHYLPSYVHALQWFERATVVSVLLVGFFNFYFDQLLALLGIISHALMLYALNVLITTSANKVSAVAST
jgi:hypothetical protein